MGRFKEIQTAQLTMKQKKETVWVSVGLWFVVLASLLVFNLMTP